MALAEGAALGVLPGQADRRAVGQDAGEGERLGVRPVEIGALRSTRLARLREMRAPASG